MDLSIVIPAFNERHKIGPDVRAAAAFLRGEGLSGEIIIVDDGSTDGTGAEARNEPVPAGVVRRVIRHERNHGKGCGVRTGLLTSVGDYAMFADSGLCMPFRNALRGLALLSSGTCEIAHGSRRLPGSVVLRPTGLCRRTLSGLFSRTIPRLAGTPPHLTDTQCGFKLYRGDVARELYARCRCDGFMFDIEMILRAVRAGYRIEEFPVEWQSDPDTRLRVIRAIPQSLSELLAIRRTLAAEAGFGP